MENTRSPLLPEVDLWFSTVLADVADVPMNRRFYFKKWLSDFLEFCRYRHLLGTDAQALVLFLDGLVASGKPGFQIDQARLAVNLYWMHLGHAESTSKAAQVGKGVTGMGGQPSTPARSATTAEYVAGVASSMPVTRAPVSTVALVTAVGAQGAIPELSRVPEESRLSMEWLAVGAEVTRQIKLRHYSPKTLKAYKYWAGYFARFVRNLPPGAVTDATAREFLTHLAEDGVSQSTQNQAFSGLLFLFRNVLQKPMTGMETTPRAARRHEVPTVMSRDEVHAVFARLEYPYHLFVQLLYGCGLRLSEALGLRIQDLDLGSAVVRVHAGKGNKARSLPLPRTLIPALKNHLESVRGLFDTDIKVGFAGAFLSEPFMRKLPGAERRWEWQWVFPAGRLTLSKEDGKPRRFHLHETSIQKEVKAAAIAAGLTKRVSPHSFRHSYATHLLQMGYDIRVVQDLLGHTDVSTTMIYTHALQALAGKVLSPLDI